MEPLRVAILGYGRNGGSMHAGAIEAIEDFRLAAACDIDPDRRRQAEERFGCPVYDDYHRMLEAETLDLVSIVTRSDQHCRMTCDCLQAGVNVLVTKPWCVSLPEAETMVEAVRGSDNLLLPWLPARWGADFRRIRQLVAEGAVGKVFFVRRFQSSFATRNDWQTERRFGGGYLLNWGPHLVDTAIGITGAKVRSAYGRLKQTINPGDAEDVFYAVLNLDDGVVATAEYTVTPEPLPNWYVQGDGGTLISNRMEIRVYSGGPSRPEDPTHYPGMAGKAIEAQVETLDGDPYGDATEIYRAVARTLRGKESFPVAPADALELTRVLDAIRQADAEDRIVRL